MVRHLIKKSRGIKSNATEKAGSNFGTWKNAGIGKELMYDFADPGGLRIHHVQVAIKRIRRMVVDINKKRTLRDTTQNALHIGSIRTIKSYGQINRRISQDIRIKDTRFT